MLIVGLGNPGRKYRKTRHNVGFLMLDYFVKTRFWKKDKKGNYLFLRKKLGQKEITFVKPLTCMNKSGEAVEYIFKKNKLSPEELVVIHDDLDLRLGTIKISKGIGSAGHKGIRSIIDKLKTKDFIRLRIGIGPLNESKLDDFVLQRFNKQEQETLQGIKKRAGQALQTLIEKGIAQAMNQFN
jgi:PTH1 family peptidyl-tRNA hydrolase